MLKNQPKMKIVKNSLRILKRVSFGILLFLLLYILAAFLLSRITVNGNAENQSKDISIYIMTNGVHTDLVVPVKSEIKDWSEEIKFENTKAQDSTNKFIAFGWGDKGFYLDTPEWSDLKASTAFNAAFGLGTSAMHVTFLKSVRQNESCVRIDISNENYQKLVNYIRAGFQYDNNHNPIFIETTTYGKHDSFYEGMGRYNLFQTCNSWANNGLKTANQKAALWTITDSGIFCHYK